MRRNGAFFAACVVGLLLGACGASSATRGFDVRLADAVSFHDCAAVTTNDTGLGAMGVLNERATRRFAAMCLYAGDNDTLLSFSSVAKMRAAVAASAKALVGMSLCESTSRAQLIAWNTDTYPRRNAEDLHAACAAIHAHMVTP
jgi:hypothetical protein